MKNPKLWAAIRSFDLDQTEAVLTFTRRFAQDHNVSEDQAREAVAEYKRFMYLVASTGHDLAPSHMIDLVWQLHMTYKTSYWEEFCDGILKKRVHFYESSGERADTKQRASHYQDIVKLYEDEFGTAPPLTIWAPIDKLVHRRTIVIDPEDRLVVPKHAITKELISARDEKTQHGESASFARVAGVSFGIAVMFTVAVGTGAWSFSVVGIVILILYRIFNSIRQSTSSGSSGESTGD